MKIDAGPFPRCIVEVKSISTHPKDFPLHNMDMTFDLNCTPEAHLGLLDLQRACVL